MSLYPDKMWVFAYSDTNRELHPSPSVMPDLVTPSIQKDNNLQAVN